MMEINQKMKIITSHPEFQKPEIFSQKLELAEYTHN